MSFLKKPLLSIVIATKDRQYYCIEAIKSILSIKSQDFQLAIADNSSTDQVKQYVDTLNDPRLTYLYDNSPTSSIANFNKALALAKGEYVCMIGDDDGVNPEIIEVTQWAKDNKIDAVIGSICANYRWENTGAPDTFFTKMTGSTLTISNFNESVCFVDLQKSLDKLMSNGCTNYLDFKFPKLYHGIVKKSYFENLKFETGDYLKGLSPDIYSAVALACRIQNLVYIDYPITIPGVCGVSTSIIEGQKKSNSKKIEDIPHLKHRGPYFWNQNVPKFYCVQTIWADSCFAVLNEIKRTDLLQKFNRFALYANILDADFKLRFLLVQDIKAECKKNNRLFFTEIFITTCFFISIFIKKNIFNRAYSRLKIILRITRFKNILQLYTINDAMIALNKYLVEHKIPKAIDLLNKTTNVNNRSDL